MAGCLAGIAGFTLALCALVIGTLTSETVAATYSAAAIGWITALLWLRRQTAGTVACAAGLLSTAPLASLAAAFTLSEPLVASDWRCGTGLVGLVLVAPLAFGGFSAAGATLGSITLRLRQPLVAHTCVAILRVGGIVGILFVAMLAAGALARSTAPDPAEWLDSLPTVGHLPRADPSECDTGPCEPTLERFDVAGYTFERSCSATAACRLRLADASTAEDGSYWAEGAHGRVRIARRESLIIVGRTAAFDLRDGGRVVDVDVTRIAGSLSAPRAWRLIALAGAFLAMFAVGRAVHRVRGRRLVRGARTAFVQDGVLIFDDGAHPMRARALGPVADGPVVALPTGRTAPPSYRDPGEGAPWRAVPGRKAEILERSRRAELAAWLAAAAIAVLAATPLFVAWRYGLLF